jgi:hypothetical protein
MTARGNTNTSVGRILMRLEVPTLTTKQFLNISQLYCFAKSAATSFRRTGRQFNWEE